MPSVRLHRSLFLTSIISLCLLSGVATANTKVNIVGLFSGKAVMIINDAKPRTLSAGQTVDGVKLIAADSSSATLLIEGKIKKIKHGAGSFSWGCFS